MSSSKIQEYNLDPNMGLAKEESVQEILSQMGHGVTANVVKSVQRGISPYRTTSKRDTSVKTSANTSYSPTYVDIPISEVTPTKCNVSINGHNDSGNYQMYKLESTYLRVYAEDGTSGAEKTIGAFTWEITEYY